MPDRPISDTGKPEKTAHNTDVRTPDPPPPPPLNALRAFEAVARSLSFTKAADQLLVTQSAASRQVKNLEDILGVQLLKRKGPLELTEEGVSCCRS